MKFLAIFSTAFFVAAAAAQSIQIGAPADQAYVTHGQNFTVEVDRPNFLSSAEEVAVVIALQQCRPTGCVDSNELLGAILYKGAFDPEYHTQPPYKPPYQNFSVTVPSSYSGTALLSVVHFSLIGAGPFPNLEVKNVTLNIV